MNKKRAFIWGAGDTGKKVYEEYKSQIELIGFIDMNQDKWSTIFQNHNVYSPEILKNTDKYDTILLGTCAGGDVPDILKNMGVSYCKLDSTYVELFTKPRISFLKNYSAIMNNFNGTVAEAGVFRGEFAKEINACFPNSNCYLFDTFEGFDKRDLETEKIYTSSLVEGNLNTTSENIVLNKMPYKDKVKIFKGYFPETVTDEVLNQKYIFVNLDMDLYKPTLEGLRIFWDRMIDGGVILVHDYFSEAFPNIRQAIHDFENEINTRLHKIPIGDKLSIALIK